MSQGQTSLRPRFEEPEHYPYRRVWRTTLLEVLILLLAVAMVLIATNYLKIDLKGLPLQIFTWGFAVLPVILWLLISYRAERQSINRRPYLFRVMFLSALLANAIGVPLTNYVFTPDEWLSNVSGFNRLIGYMLTVGLTQEFIKYVAVRYVVWPNSIRIRLDGIAYALAASMGYAVVLNLNYALTAHSLPLATALRMAENTFTQLAVSVIMGYFLAELKLSNSLPIFLPLGLLIAAFFNALSLIVRGGLVVSAVSTTSTASNIVQGLGMSVLLVFVLFSTFNFLINNADEREFLRGRRR